MKKLKLKHPLLRPADGFLPLALALASGLGRSDVADNLFHYMLFARLFALASVLGLRQAFSEQPSMRRARGSVKAALLLQPVGALVTLMLFFANNRGLLSREALIYTGAGMLLNVECVFYEYLSAAGEGLSAEMLHGLAAALTLGGILFTSPASTDGLMPYALEGLLGAAALCAAVAAVVGIAIGGRLKGRLNPQVLKCAPLAILQCFVYPLAWMAVLSVPGSFLRGTLTSIPFFAGLTLYELCRSPFRRSSMESRPLNAALSAVALVSAVVFAVCHFAAFPVPRDLPATAGMLIVASVCAFAMYGRLPRRE